MSLSAAASTSASGRVLGRGIFTPIYNRLYVYIYSNARLAMDEFGGGRCRSAGKVALVAGATRGAGRGIAVELGAAGATVYVTGRTTRDQQSE